jgi:hypothetical protein
MARPKARLRSSMRRWSFITCYCSAFTARRQLDVSAGHSLQSVLITGSLFVPIALFVQRRAASRAFPATSRCGRSDFGHTSSFGIPQASFSFGVF